MNNRIGETVTSVNTTTKAVMAVLTQFLSDNGACGTSKDEGETRNNKGCETDNYDYAEPSGADDLTAEQVPVYAATHSAVAPTTASNLKAASYEYLRFGRSRGFSSRGRHVEGLLLVP